MLNFKCPNCDGEMSVNSSGDLLCSYCDSKFNFTDKDLSEYKVFRRNMLYYLSAVANRTAAGEDAERLWQKAAEKVLASADGREITINYIYMSEQDGVQCYTARNNVLFIFPPTKTALADKFIAGTKLVSYPSADVRDLAQYFPVITGSFTLKDGSVMLSVSKPEEVFPLGAFGSLPPVHAAWIVSRLENLCCVLEYSGMTHGGITLNSLFINARTHELYLLGGWYNAQKTSSRTDLTDLRKTVKHLMGRELGKAPVQFREFLDKKHLPDAYTDFADWDNVIETGFGGRRFEKLDLTNISL